MRGVEATFDEYFYAAGVAICGAQSTMQATSIWHAELAFDHSPWPCFC